MIYGYVRVSTQEQSVESQKNSISRYCIDQKIMVDEWIELEMFSRKSTAHRRIAEWNYQKLADVLECLKVTQSAVHPVQKIALNPTKYIIFDAPLGRFHTQTGVYIDTWIHIDVPLDVSLCRWILRNYKETRTTKNELLDDLEFYLNQSRPLFDDTKFKIGADLIMDGMLSTKQQALLVKQYLRKFKY